MKNYSKLVIFATITLALTTAAISSIVSISPALAAPAIHIEKDGCGMGDGDGNAAFFPDATVRQVQAQSENNNIVYVCTADVPNNSGHAVKYDTQNNPVEPGLKCASAFSVTTTTDWQETISASGNAKLICHFKS
jgi:hypothetical protein